MQASKHEPSGSIYVYYPVSIWDADKISPLQEIDKVPRLHDYPKLVRRVAVVSVHLFVSSESAGAMIRPTE